MWRFVFFCILPSFVASESRCTSTTNTLEKALSQCESPQVGLDDDADWVLTINDLTGGKQKVDGFGAAWTDATVEVFDSLQNDDQESLLEDLFGSSGIELTLMRHTVGQSDLTPEDIGAWSYDETDGDEDLTDFDLTDPGERMVDWLSRMRAASSNQIMLLGSIWSPPRWMKQNNNLQWGYRNAWADYIVKYLTAFADRGVTVDAVTLQNEPLHSGDDAWTMFMDASYAAILSNLTRFKLAASDLETEIWAYDHNTNVPEYPQYVLDNTPVGTNQAVAWHCYAWDLDWGVLSAFHESNPTIPQYMTECWLHLDSGESFFDLPNFFIGPLQNYASGVVAWILGGSVDYDVGYPGGCGQCSGIIQVNMTAQTYEKTQDYFTLGQFSKFIQKDAQVLETLGNYDYIDGTGVQTVAFRNSNEELVLVILNKITTGMKINIALESGGGWNAQVEGSSITTFVLNTTVISD